ncbi:MAG: ABC transporter ATP-binding protein [Micrococcaceae bacterium]|nr:ABC transporter ATP-binding protein [Micrococcaceae bacterium]
MEYRVKTERPEDRRFGRYRKTTKTVLKDISFAAREKDFIGIIGRNGSGKSTLLRVLAGLETPTSGQVFASDKPQLLGVNAALMPTLTGNENVMLGLLAMGYTPAEAEEIRPRVIDLAQIGDAIYAPMKTYSSGMGARLRFAISVAAAPRILMVDEALATGDATFQERSKQAMNSMIKETGTVFLVNHSRSAIESMCNRVIWLEEGEIVSDGSPKLKMEQFAVFTYALSQGNREYAFRFLDKVREKYKKPR